MKKHYVQEHPLVIKLEGITFGYPENHTNVFDGLDFEVRQKDRIGIKAHNGSGKTTLFHMIMGLVQPNAGTIEIFGNQVSMEKDFEIVRRRIGLLFQDADDQLFSPTVLEDVAFGPLNLGKTPAQAKHISTTVLNQLGLQGYENRITYKLSGGEKRLVSLATVLAMEPEVLLLDEPSSGLDENTKKRLIDVLSKLDLTYVLICHEDDFLYQLAESIYTMESGKLCVVEKHHRPDDLDLYNY